jgi:hypothetical protein
MHEPSESELREWRSEFEAAARRPLRTRFRYAFIHTYKRPTVKDREALPRLRAFFDYWKQHHG